MQKLSRIILMTAFALVSGGNISLGRSNRLGIPPVDNGRCKVCRPNNDRRLVMKSLKYSIVILALLLVCSSISTGAERKEFTATVDRDGVQRVSILGGSYFFNPNDIIMKVNVPVELKIKKEPGIVPHNFVLHAPEAGMDVKVDLGTEPTVVRFTPTKTGKYPFSCDKKVLFFESHREKGMEGVIEVRE